MKFSLAINHRKIFLYDEISENVIFEALYYLHKIIDLDNRAGTKLPIEIHINSNGGLVEDGYTLISLIENMKKDGYEIKTINIGRAYSMGLTIFLSGSTRLAYAYSRFMYHDFSYGSYGSSTSIKRAVQEAEILSEVINNYIIKNSKITKETLLSHNDKVNDWYISPEEAITFGIVDEII
jgi:ATP-dependent Clp protease protease subunit